MTSLTSRRLLAAPAALLLVLGLAACGGDDEDTSTGSQQPAAGTCEYVDTAQPAAREVERPPSELPEDAPGSVTITTDQGDIPVELDREEAPCAVNSFLSLAEQGYFDDTPCHRLVTEGILLLQCGDPSGTGSEGPGYSFADELDENDPRLQPCLDQVDPNTGRETCTYTTGTVAMANAGPDTNGSQFFLVYGDSPLGNAYTVIGRMNAAGVQVVSDVAADGNGPDGIAPATSVTIESVA